MVTTFHFQKVHEEELHLGVKIMLVLSWRSQHSKRSAEFIQHILQFLDCYMKLVSSANTSKSYFIKVKVKLSLCLIKHHAMKTLHEWGYSSNILDLGTRRRWMASLMPWLSYLWGNILQHPHWIRGWMGPRASLDIMEKININILPLPG
jgi:hypothetical protein